MTPLEELRHSSAHVLATAVLRLFPHTKLDIGPPTDSGFYYDFDLEHKFTAADLEQIEEEMRKVIQENQKFERIETTREEARHFFEEKEQPYKLERLDDIPEESQVTFYRNGEFVDLCAGTHVNYTKKIKAFKLLSIAGAYYRGDEKNKQMQRIYGTAFASRQELEAFLHQREEAKKRDHRRLGKELNFFHIDEAVGQGLILWAPNGAIVRQELQNFISAELRKQDYLQVFTPHIGKLGLYRTSGHFPFYQDSQYPPIIERDSLSELASEGCSCSELSNKLDEGTIEGYLLKPMNCPHHIKIFDSQPHSYRDLPVRLAEFGTVYRWEQSGELNGMTRVRGFTQDDAHIFCTEEQLSRELMGCLALVKTVLLTLGINDYRVRIGLRDPDGSKYIGDPENWNKAEEACRDAARTLGVSFSEERGEAAFYGPKIDFVVKDVLDREWQLGTIQVDYNLPARFNLSYIGADNQHHRPIMIHRAPFGSMERFCGVLLEHFAGDFPTWLAPEQVRLLPVSEKHFEYADRIRERLKAAHIRTEIDKHSDKLGAKIRRGQLEKIPHLLIIGAKEEEAGCVSVRSRLKGDEGLQEVGVFQDRVEKEIRDRLLTSKPASTPESG